MSILLRAAARHAMAAARVNFPVHSALFYRGRAITVGAQHALPAARIFHSSHPKYQAMKDNKAITVQGRTISPTYADATGNTFQLYDFVQREPGAAWEAARQAIWKQVADKHVDDGLALRRVTANPQKLDVKMHVLEPDGTEADFCGNGARATATYLTKTYGGAFSQFALHSRRGEHPIRQKDGVCYVNMGEPLIDSKTYPFVYQGKTYQFAFVDAVEPHLVTKDLFDQTLLTQVGAAINKEWKERFPNGVNVNCLRVVAPNKIDVLTYERGLYQITKACGTGSTACVAAAIQQGLLKTSPEYFVGVLGGTLRFIPEGKTFWFGGDVLLKR